MDKARVMRRWATVAALLAVVVVTLGAWTRLVDAGLGCPDWPGCYGFLIVPQDEARIAIAEARFPDSPVDVAKGWPEMIHRYAAALLGLVVFGLAGYAARHRRTGLPVKLAMFIAVFILLQGAFGMWTVTLKLWPQVVALHLLGGFTTLTLLALLRLRVGRLVSAAAGGPPRGWRLEASPLPADRLRVRLARLRPWLYGGLVLVAGQIALGAWTAANYAAVACLDLPTCQGQWWPEMDFRHGFDITQAVGPNYLGGQLAAAGRVAIHVSHRLGALVVVVYWLALLTILWRQLPLAVIRQAAAVVAALVVAQVALGLLNIALYLPLGIAVAHNAGGAALLVAVVWLLWRVYGVQQATAVSEPHRFREVTQEVTV
ncbi:COX15/CtaA family protein [Marinobacter sp. X15-166B]|uniref:COX15/CtaA family protein n=1 Tax=Marinobacter sp. X15-166B TaxID=1897620 RepID=UPI00085C6E44|nr:COX15/CtaA family protein [Marinobacter sp. X15-166B]OEY66166.1 cytochrome B [Marinobacter sp. X15-166B]